MGALVIFGVLGAAFYFLVFAAPTPDIVFTSASSDELIHVQNALKDAGIRTYTKNVENKYLQKPSVALSELGQGSLHVVNIRERDRGLHVVAELAKSV